MENSDNVFLNFKMAVVGACGLFTAAFGWLGWFVVIWVICMVADWITGSMSAASQGEWKSSVARKGIWHKAGMVAVVGVAALADCTVGMAIEHIPGVASLPIEYTALICPIVLCWYIFTELGSIIENARDMGAPVPKKLVELLASAQKATGADEAAGSVDAKQVKESQNKKNLKK